MTACHPRKDSWRWQTSNSEYGKFYVSIHREVVKSREAHKDCSNTCESLSNDLQLAKAQLEKLKISCGRTLCNPDGPAAQGAVWHARRGRRRRSWGTASARARRARPARICT